MEEEKKKQKVVKYRTGEGKRRRGEERSKRREVKREGRRWNLKNQAHWRGDMLKPQESCADPVFRHE